MKAKHTELKTSGHMVPIAGFGAALAALTVPTNVDAAIVELTPTPGSQPYASNTVVTLGVGGEAPYDFFQYNDRIGKTLVGSTSYYANIYGFRPAPFSTTISTGQFFTYYLSAGLGTSASGTATFGFLTNANQVGWIQMNLGGTAGNITYLAAAFNDTPGGSIGAGKLEDPTAVPEPETLPLVAMGLLALGAAGVRRHRRRRVKTSETAA